MITNTARLLAPSLFVARQSIIPQCRLVSVSNYCGLLNRTYRNYTITANRGTQNNYISNFINGMITNNSNKLITRYTPNLASGLIHKIFNLFDFTVSIIRMSSTMKKRRAKMNKHKLRKRRKLLRRKSKG